MAHTLLSVLQNQFLEGLGVGLLLGIMVGAAWENAYEMIYSAIREKQGLKNRSDMNLRRNWLAILLGLTSVMMMVIGAFQIYAYTHAANFARCQANFNQQSSEARQVRTDAASVQNDALYAWIKSLPSITGGAKHPPTPKAIEHFRDTLNQAIKTYNQNVRAQKQNPYPADPEDTCGSY